MYTFLSGATLLQPSILLVMVDKKDDLKLGQYDQTKIYFQKV